jgi:hypothetical protein
LSELYGYSTPLVTFLVQKEFSLHRPVLIFQHTVTSTASDNRSRQWQKHITQLGKMRSCEVSTYISCLWSGLGGGGVTFWLQNETLTFIGPAAKQATVGNQIGVNKIPPNFDTLFATYI